MNRALISLVTFLVIPAGFAAQSANQPSKVPFLKMEKQDTPLEDLAHSFLFHFSESNKLKSLIGEEGLARIRPELARLQNEMTDLRRIAPRTREMCARLQRAQSGRDFAAVFVDAEKIQQSEMKGHARSILSALDVNDRGKLEHYLNVEYRQSFNRIKVDYDAMYATVSFPSLETNAITKKTCDSAAEMEARVPR
jgi:hypothetical protein